MRALDLILVLTLASTAWCADAVAPAPLSARTEQLAAAQAAVGTACDVTGTLARATLMTTPGVSEHLPANYAQQFGQSVQSIPTWMAREGVYQRIVAKDAVARMGINPQSVDVFLDSLDHQAGVLVDEVSRPDVVLRAFDVYRDQPAPTAIISAPATQPRVAVPQPLMAPPPMLNPRIPRYEPAPLQSITPSGQDRLAGLDNVSLTMPEHQPGFWTWFFWCAVVGIAAGSVVMVVRWRRAQMGTP